MASVAMVTIEYTDGSKVEMEFSSVEGQSGTSSVYVSQRNAADLAAEVRLEEAISAAVTDLGLWPTDGI